MDINDILAKAGDRFAVDRAFGTPVEKDGTVLIPVAVAIGGGGGGQGSSKKAQEGEGGGFGGLVYPLGVYTVREGHVRFVPSVNVTRIITAVLLMMRVVSKSRMKVTLVRGARRRGRESPPRLGISGRHEVGGGDG